MSWWGRREWRSSADISISFDRETKGAPETKGNDGKQKENKKGLRRTFGREAEDEKGSDSGGSWLCPLRIIKVSLLLTRPGLGQDAPTPPLPHPKVKNKDQYAGHRADEEVGGEGGESAVFTAAVPLFPLTDSNANGTVSFQRSKSDSGFFYWALMV